MDWFKLFAMLMLSALCSVATGSSRKKIRIHIPQKVKHIHHHKKIYITQHPAPTQYAPAFLPAPEGAAVALPTAVALPAAVAGLVPLKPLPYYEERRSGRLHGISAASSPLLPMYRARGYYGPTTYDHFPPDSLTAPSSSGEPSSPSLPPTTTPVASPRVKVIKITEPRKKKIIKKKKPKRIIIQEEHEEEEVEEPVSTYHDEFYSDLNASGSIKTVKKPKRVEKYIDGDTEHIHTYSEEHIHQFVYDDQNHNLGDPALEDGLPQSEAPLRAPSSIRPLSHYSGRPSSYHQPLDSIYKPSYGVPSTAKHPFSGSYPNSGSFSSLYGASPNSGHSSYGPQDITHDHLYHDHGEVPLNFDFSKPYNNIPKGTYTSDGTKIGGSSMNQTSKKRKTKPKTKGKWVSQDNVVKSTKHNPDLSYYEGMYAPSYTKPKKSQFSNAKYPFKDEVPFNSDVGYDEFNYKPKYKTTYKAASSPYANRSPPTRKPGIKVKYHNAETTPFGSSSLYQDNNSYKGYKDSFSRVRDSYHRDPYNSYRDSYAPATYDYDAFGSPSNAFEKERDTTTNVPWRNKKGKGKKKSVSTQNISFGGQDHKTVIDHIAESSDVIPVVDESIVNISKDTIVPNDYPYAAVESYAPMNDYYGDMAVKAFEASSVIPEASNTNFRIVEPPPDVMSTSSAPDSAEMPIAVYVKSDPPTEMPVTVVTAQSAPRRNKKKPADKPKTATKQSPNKDVKFQHAKATTLDERGRFKFGDRVDDGHTLYASMHD